MSLDCNQLRKLPKAERRLAVKAYLISTYYAPFLDKMVLFYMGVKKHPKLG
jgi:hypothetical protein